MTMNNSGAGSPRPVQPAAGQSGNTAPSRPAGGTTDLQTKQTDEQSAGTVGTAIEQAKDMAGDLVEQAKDQVSPRVDSQKERAVGGLNDTAKAIRQTSKQMREQGGGTIAQYADQTAVRVESVAEYLRTREVSEIVSEVESFGKRQPAVFVGGAFALGLLAARFLKSSGQRESSAASGQASALRRATPPPQTPAARPTTAQAPTPMHPTGSPAGQQASASPLAASTPHADPSGAALFQTHNPSTAAAGAPGAAALPNASGMPAREQH